MIHALKNSFLLLIAAVGGASLLLVACTEGHPEDDDDTTPLVDCETATIPTFSEVTIWPKCTNCHASTLAGSDRGGAPPGIDYDVYASAVQYADLAVEEVEEGAMPYPDGSGVTAEEKQSLYAWAECGTPE